MNKSGKKTVNLFNWVIVIVIVGFAVVPLSNFFSLPVPADPFGLMAIVIGLIAGGIFVVSILRGLIYMIDAVKRKLVGHADDDEGDKRV